MNAQVDELRLDVGDFLNFYPLRAPRMMWFLGAGASVAAGIPTAETLTWEFKRQLFCTAHKIPLTRFPDLNDRAFQTHVQSYFNVVASFPSEGDVGEYAFYFQRYLPDEGDRRRLLEARLTGIKPSYGHFCLGALLALGKVQLVWTINFDPLIERATRQNGIADRMPQEPVTLSHSSSEKPFEYFRDARWPLLVKLHGDYQFRRLGNTAAEVQAQDMNLRERLTDECIRRGLAVVGYSGRDETVMNALRQALETSGSFPEGLFWFVRSGHIPAAPIMELLAAVRKAGRQSAFIEVGGFDELMADLFLPHHEDLPAVKDLVKAQREKRRPVQPVYRGRDWPAPVVRTNALEITKFPSSCTVFQADLGGAKQVKEAATGHWARVTAGRRKNGIVAFGTRSDLLKVFGDFNARAFERHPIESARLHYEDSAEIGLFYDAICQAISHQTGLCRSQHQKGRLLFLPTANLLNAREKGLFRAQGVIDPVHQPQRKGPLHHEGFRVSLEYCDQRLWLLLEPTVVITENGIKPYAGENRAEFTREALVRRYNRVANGLLSLWVEFLQTRCGNPLRFCFPTPEETEAEFEVRPITAYARQTK